MPDTDDARDTVIAGGGPAGRHDEPMPGDEHLTRPLTREKVVRPASRGRRGAPRPETAEADAR